jgi:hypothetical protein
MMLLSLPISRVMASNRVLGDGTTGMYISYVTFVGNTRHVTLSHSIRRLTLTYCLVTFALYHFLVVSEDRLVGIRF